MQANDDCVQQLKNRAVHLLSIREHGRQELARKLTQKIPDCSHCLDAVLAELETVGYLNEQRYVEAFIRKEQALGHGLLRIKAALRDKQADADVVNAVLSDSDTNWRQLAQQVRIKKFGAQLPTDRADIATQMRFLSYRGFDSDTVRYVLKNLSDDE
jgi:regulatory protein